MNQAFATRAALVLVVDDHDAGRFAKRQIMERAGLRVVDASTGAEALARVASESPDLILLDINLPDVSGLEVTRRIRARENGPPTIQILHISGTAIGPGDRVRGLEEGADVYLTEPVEPQVLIATVHSLLRVRRAETALAEALANERRARQDAEEANRLKDEFLATLSHELRTPLNALMGWIWQLRHSNLDTAKQRRALDSLERNAGIQAQLINDLLDISRITKGKLQLEIRPLELRAVVDAALDSVKESSENKHIRVEVTGAGVWTAGDQARLLQVVANLLTNAVQFTPEGGRITVTIAEDAGQAIVRVQDTGAGIDPAFLPHVFDQFRQAEGGLSRKHGGLGLGLTVVRQLIELHGGTVSVASAGVGAGATFTVSLPKEPAAIQAAEQPPPPLLTGLHVLIVDDSLTEREATAAILESSGARVTAVPREAVSQALADDSFAAVVSQMPCEGARGLPRVIASKPVQPAQLVRSVARVVREKAPQPRG